MHRSSEARVLEMFPIGQGLSLSLSLHKTPDSSESLAALVWKSRARVGCCPHYKPT